MNNLTATYIDIIQTIGVMVIFGVAAYVVKQMLLKAEQHVERVDFFVNSRFSDYLAINCICLHSFAASIAPICKGSCGRAPLKEP